MATKLRALLALVMLGTVACALVSAQDGLLDDEPHDLLTIPDGKDTKILKVYPVKLPNRRLPKDVKPTDRIRVRLLEDDESRDFDVMWRDVKKLEFFEDRILAEAESLTAAGKLDDAYVHYAYLLRNYPDTQRLEESIQSYWYLSAGASFRERRYDEALAVLEELIKKNPGYKHSDTSPSLMNVLGGICDRLVQRYLEKNDYRTASRLIGRITTAYPDSKQEPFYGKFNNRMTSAAESKRDEARKHLAAQRYTEAYDATSAMLDIQPNVSGGRELAAEMNEQYPLAVVAVETLATAPNAVGLDNWADLRAGRLTDRRLTELRGIGPEGGNYACSLGTCERSEDLRSLTIALSGEDPSFTTYDVLQLLLAGGQPGSPVFSAAWAQALRGARIVRPGQVEVTLRASHLLPQALLALPLSSPGSEHKNWSGNYILAAKTDTISRFVLPATSPRPRGKPREIQERVYPSPEAAILALQRGEVDALDRLQPADIAAVRGMPAVKIVRYAVPTVHVLVPNVDRPWPANRTFRRAIMYALQRDSILQQGILHGEKLEGAKVISGPLPSMSGEDALSYAYDDSIPPHAFEPLLSVTLLDLAKREIDSAANLKGEKPPARTEVVIGHAPQELQRIACKAMSKQLTALSIPCKAVELKNGQATDECDFVYAELLVSEPTIDAVRLFGPDGLYSATNPHVRLAVRQIEQATTWNQAGQRLRQLHRVLHEDLALLPLWQTPEHFAVRENVQGISAKPVSLYQDIQQWRVAPRLGQN
jgi:tetratricopeptide (TPR) repeat protein